MEINKLEAFCKVVELKSFTKAAEAVLLTQPTVSEHIRSLEQELGERLLDRLGRVVEPTPVGHLFYGYARKILQIRQEGRQAGSGSVQWRPDWQGHGWLRHYSWNVSTSVTDCI